jgi:hypothetical protein
MAVEQTYEIGVPLAPMFGVLNFSMTNIKFMKFKIKIDIAQILNLTSSFRCITNG